MKDALGHGSDARGGPAHQAGINNMIPRVVAYHGTTNTFGGMPGAEPHAQPEWELLDRMLGQHYAADPEVSNSFTEERVNGTTRGAKEGGREFAVTLPSEDKFLEVPQPRYDHAIAGEPEWRSRATDQRQIEGMIMKEAFKQDPEMLSRYLTEARAVPQEQAGPLARDMAAGKTVDLPTDGKRFNLDRFISNIGGRPYNASDRVRAVDLARSAWQAQGYKGLKYINTSPMEMATAKNPRAYVLFDPKDAKSKWSGS